MRKAVKTLIPGGERPEVQGSCWEGQPAKAQLGYRIAEFAQLSNLEF